MAYVKKGPFTDSVATPPINAAFLNGVETALLQTAVYYAPAPSGADDTATLQTLLTAAQSTNGTLVLGAGTYKANLVTMQSFTQPRIVGQGNKLTILQGTVNTSPVIRYKGGSGDFSGGYLADFTITGTAGIGLQIADAGGVHWNRLRFTGTLAEGIEFLSEASGGFAEFNSGDAIIDQSVVLPVRYAVTGGTGSFHGTGLTDGSAINQSSSATSPMIQIDSGANPYAAPMTVAFFPRAGNGIIIQNNSGTPASFYGHLDIEVQGTGPNYVAQGQKVFYTGTIGSLAAANLKLGSLYLAHKIYLLQGAVIADLRPYQRGVTLAAGKTGLTQGDAISQSGAAFLINVNVNGPNYFYNAQLMCWQSPFNPAGTASAVASSLQNNGSSAGAPTFTWENYGLSIINANYSSAYVATVGVSMIGGSTNLDVMGQS